MYVLFMLRVRGSEALLYNIRWIDSPGPKYEI